VVVIDDALGSDDEKEEKTRTREKDNFVLTQGE
jgi:hypothetical protein